MDSEKSGKSATSSLNNRLAENKIELFNKFYEQFLSNKSGSRAAVDSKSSSKHYEKDALSFDTNELIANRSNKELLQSKFKQHKGFSVWREICKSEEILTVTCKI